MNLMVHSFEELSTRSSVYRRGARPCYDSFKSFENIRKECNTLSALTENYLSYRMCDVNFEHFVPMLQLENVTEVRFELL